MRMAVGSVFSDDIAIDLGTANTLVHVVGRGIIIDEPSVVALQVRGGHREVMAVGLTRQGHAGRSNRRSPSRSSGPCATASSPISSPPRRCCASSSAAPRPCWASADRGSLSACRRRHAGRAPRGLETAMSAGARKVYLIEEPVAASLGAGLPDRRPAGFMVVDIGGGTTDIAVLSLGQVVQARSLRCAGNAMDEAIMRYVRRRHGLVIGEGNAERIKIEAGTALARCQTAGRSRSTSRAATSAGPARRACAGAACTWPRRSPAR